jgi:hypothetical protein
LQQKQHGWSLFAGNANFRRSVLLGVFLQAMQQFSGKNVVMYYALRVFKLAGFGFSAQMWVAPLSAWRCCAASSPASRSWRGR